MRVWRTAPARRRGARAARADPPPAALPGPAPEPKARQFALALDRGVGQPDLGHQVTPRERREHAGVDLVLHASGASPMTPAASAISTSHPNSCSWSCTNRAPVIDSITPRRQTMRAGAPRQPAHAVRIRRRPLLDDLPGLRQQAHVDRLSTQIQSSVQHEDGPPRARSSVTRRASHRGGPPSSQSVARVVESPVRTPGSPC